MKNQDVLLTYCLRLGDNSLILGQRLSELCSKAPFLEEDLALTNVALDLIGRAQALFKYASEIENKGNDEDIFAYRREEPEYLNNLITELPNGDFAHVITRLFFISAFEYDFYSELENCKDKTLAGIASKAVKECRYHLQHSKDWVIRLGDGTQESHDRMQKAVNDLWMYTSELFEMDAIENELLQKGMAVDLVPLKKRWENQINSVLKEATLVQPISGHMQTGGREGIHTEYMGHLLTEMQYLQRSYPDAKW